MSVVPMSVPAVVIEILMFRVASVLLAMMFLIFSDYPSGVATPIVRSCAMGRRTAGQIVSPHAMHRLRTGRQTGRTVADRVMLRSG